MATVNYRIRSKANKPVSIKVYLSTGRGNVLEINTGFSINPKDWSDTTNRPKQNNPENKHLSNNLNKLQIFILENLNRDLSNGTFIDIFWLNFKITECFNRIEKVDQGLIVNHIQYIIDNANTRKIQGRNKLGLSLSRVKSYQTFKKVIETYQTEIKKQLHFLDINKSFVDRFTNWLINTKNYSHNYAGKQIDNLKTVCLDAEKTDLVTNPYFKQISSFKENKEDRFIVTLSFDELEQIKNATIESEALNNARNWILLGCEVGQRAGDLLNITKSNIRFKSGNYYLDVVQQKTGKSVTIPIIAPRAIDIIENNFPRKISTQKLNEYIKTVCEMSKINEVIQGRKFNAKTHRKELGYYPKYELLISHSFRRSFATNYYKKIATAVLIGITGHSKESLFLEYINQSEDKDSNADMFRYLYERMNNDEEKKLKVV